MSGKPSRLRTERERIQQRIRETMRDDGGDRKQPSQIRNAIRTRKPCVRDGCACPAYIVHR